MPAGITSSERRIVHQILREAGYLVTPPSDCEVESNVAAMLLIKLFTDGVTDPSELSRQLEYRFGKHPQADRALPEFAPNHAIRGLKSPDHAGCPTGRDREHWTQAATEWRERGHLSEAPRVLRDHVNRVLVVDDEPLIRFATVEALEDAGFEVLEAGNADEALVLLQNNDVDAVFTDVNMPGTTDGLGLMAQIRERAPQTRVIVTSGHVRLGAFDLSSGVSFIPKPYTHDAIVGMLKALGN